MHTLDRLVNLDRELERALSGSRQTDTLTRQEVHDFSWITLAQGNPDAATRRIIERRSSIGGQQAGGAVVPMATLQRDSQATIFAQGGAFVGVDLVNDPISPLRNRCVSFALGARAVTGLRGNVALPRVNNSVAPQVLTEIGPATPSDLYWDQIALTPHRITVQLLVSDRLLIQNPVAETVLKDQIADQIAVLLDREILNGQGAGSEPMGVMNTPGVNSIAFGGIASWSSVLACESALGAQNADYPATPSFAVSPSTRNRWKQIPRTGGGATPVPLFLMGDDQRVNGYRSLSTNQLSSTNQVIFGDWSQVLVGFWGENAELDVVVDKCTQAAAGKTVITVSCFFDVCLFHPTAMVVSADAANQ